MYCPECELRVADDKQTICPVCRGPLRSDQDSAGGGRLDGYRSSDGALDFDPTELGLEFFAEDESPEDVRKLARLWREEDAAADLEGVLAEALIPDEIDAESDSELLGRSSADLQPTELSDPLPAEKEPVIQEEFVLETPVEDEVYSPVPEGQEIDLEGDLSAVLGDIEAGDKTVSSQTGLQASTSNIEADDVSVGENLSPAAGSDEVVVPPPPDNSAPPASRRPLFLCLLLVLLVAGGWFGYQQLNLKSPLTSPARPSGNHQPVSRATEPALKSASSPEQPAALQPPAMPGTAQTASRNEKNEQLEAAVVEKPAQQPPVSLSASARESAKPAELKVDDEKPAAAATAVQVPAAESEAVETAVSVREDAEVPPAPAAVAAAVKEKPVLSIEPSPRAFAGSLPTEDGKVLTGNPPSASGMPVDGQAAVTEIPESGPNPGAKEGTAQEESNFKPYAVHIGSFKSMERAERHRNHLRAKNFAAYIYEVDLKNKGVWFRVLVPGGDSRQAGKEVQQALAEVFPREESRVIKIKRP